MAVRVRAAIRFSGKVCAARAYCPVATLPSHLQQTFMQRHATSSCLLVIVSEKRPRDARPVPRVR